LFFDLVNALLSALPFSIEAILTFEKVKKKQRIFERKTS